MSDTDQLLSKMLDRLERLESSTDLAITVAEAGRRLGCKRTQVFALLKAGKLQRARRWGRCTMITAESVVAALLGASARRAPRRAPRHSKTSLSADILNLPI